MYSILIVDDEPIVKIALRSILPWEEHGFSICGTASNGQDALSLIEKHHPDIIITDLKMPQMDGLHLIRILKEKNYPGEILVLSNYEDFDSVRNALTLGAADYLLKIKIQPDTLLSCLNKTIEKINKRNQTAPSKKQLETASINEILLHFFETEESLENFLQTYPDCTFMKEACSICYITFEKFLSNEAFSISKTLIRDMILDAVQGILQPYILLPNDYSALLLLSQTELSSNHIVLEQLLKKLYNRFTLYQTFAPAMPYKENLSDYEDARIAYRLFSSADGCYKTDIAKTLEYIEENYMHHLTLPSIASHVNLSPSYLCRIFKAEVGTSITNYLNNLRIRQAASMIREKNIPLKEISTLVGIDDQLYFSRLFKKNMGMSPTEYGKRFAKKNASR